MQAEIITIGDEILIGQIIDTNSSWLGQELSKIGIGVVRRTSVSDQAQAITDALNAALPIADVIILTGGLGPTKDDVTKTTLCSFFKTELVIHPEVLEWVTRIFKMRNLPMIETNKNQALVPATCEVLFNRNGTAPGMWFNHEGKVIISMPGVPFEMKSIFSEQAIPKLRERFTLPAILHRTIQTCSIGESFLAAKIESWENALPPHLKLAYLPSVGQVRLRLSGSGNNHDVLAAEMTKQVDDLYRLVGDYIFGEEDDSLQQVTGKLLANAGATLSTAESCTGGYLSHLITSVPGSSAYYTGSVISYANKIKTEILGVDPDVIKTDGAVSERCVKQMAEGVRNKFGTTYALATSGVAGPDGGSAAKPVGTVWIALAHPGGTLARKFDMGDNRERTIHRSGLQALDILRRQLLGVDNG